MTKNISIADLQVLLAAGGVNLVDVREADEYASGHVPGATNLPLSDFLYNQCAKFYLSSCFRVLVVKCS